MKKPRVEIVLRQDFQVEFHGHSIDANIQITQENSHRRTVVDAARFTVDPNVHRMTPPHLS